MGTFTLVHDSVAPDAAPRARRRIGWSAPAGDVLRLAWAPALLVALPALWPGSAVRDSLTGAPVAGARLVVPLSYVVLSPICRVLDAMSLLSTRQHAALVLTLAVTAAAAGAAHRTSARARLGSVARAIALVVLVLGVVYPVGATVPRPMAALAVEDPELVRVDFHSHTRASHDGRRGFDAERNREWHRSGGFDVAYVSDHRSFRESAAGVRGNAARGGDGTLLLSALEGRHRGVALVLLGVSAADAAVAGADGELLGGRLRTGLRPAAIATIPSDLDEIDAVAGDGTVRLSAIEIVDAAPRGLAQHDRDAQAIRERAARYRLVPVASSNNHGWGRTVAAWNLVRVPGWRSMTPAALGERIEDRLRSGPSDAVRVVERARPDPGSSAAALAATAPLLIGRMLRELSAAERLSWLAWLVVWAAGVATARARGGRRAAHTSAPVVTASRSL